MRSAFFRPGDRPLLNAGLLATTLVTTTSTFFLMFGGGVPGGVAERVVGSLMFSVSLVLILGAHEMGHYALARWHHVDTSLPYFIPVPPPLGVGTLGAVIRIRGRIPNRNALVDIGASGPLVGLVVAVPLLALGLAHSTVADAPPLAPAFPGKSSLWVLLPELWRFLAAKLTGGDVDLGTPVRASWVFGDNLLMLGVQRLVLGPIPAGKEVYVHPTVIAAWFGLLVTMLNLIPIGQLDGGHLTHAVFGHRARTIGQVMAVGMLGLCLFFSAGWLLWLIVATQVIGFKHPEVVLPEEPLTRGRLFVCALCLVALVICVMPVPVTSVTAP